MANHFRTAVGVLFLFAICCVVSGCAWFGNPGPQQPRTVSEWMSQSRVQP